MSFVFAFCLLRFDICFKFSFIIGLFLKLFLY